MNSNMKKKFIENLYIYVHHINIEGWKKIIYKKYSFTFMDLKLIFQIVKK